MPRLSIDVTPEQHKALKASALLQGKTMKQLLLEPYFPQEIDASYQDSPVQLPDGQWSGADIDGWDGLNAALVERLEEVRAGKFSTQTPAEIFDESRERYQARQAAA